MVQFNMIELDFLFSSNFILPELLYRNNLPPAPCYIVNPTISLIPSCMGSCHGQRLIEMETNFSPTCNIVSFSMLFGDKDHNYLKSVSLGIVQIFVNPQ